MRSALAAATLLVAALTGCSDDDPETVADLTEQTDHSDQAEWSYSDVDAWDETCASGTEQSPIDLTDATDESLPDLELDYQASAAEIVDNGHTIQVGLEDGGTLTRAGVAYQLVQFHAHAPSEHLLEGKPFAAEVHLVHQSEEGDLAVLGILIEKGAESSVIADVLELAPAEGADPVAATESIDVATMLPDDLRTFRYDGSLTTPPCSEGVAWSVLTTPMTWSADQIADFEARHPDSHRPPQPLGDRELLLDID